MAFGCIVSGSFTVAKRQASNDTRQAEASN